MNYENISSVFMKRRNRWTPLCFAITFMVDNSRALPGKDIELWSRPIGLNIEDESIQWYYVTTSFRLHRKRCRDEQRRFHQDMIELTWVSVYFKRFVSLILVSKPFGGILAAETYSRAHTLSESPSWHDLDMRMYSCVFDSSWQDRRIWRKPFRVEALRGRPPSTFSPFCGQYCALQCQYVHGWNRSQTRNVTEGLDVLVREAA